jgi:hypothetical protein
MEGEETKTDAFGEPADVKEEGEGEEGEGEGEKKTDKKVKNETPEQKSERLARENGELSQYKTDSERRHAEKDENLRKANETIAELRKAVEGKTKEGEEGDKKGDLLFKEIKSSKDLSADEKEEMTDTEIKQMDEIAALKSGMNSLAELITKNTKTEEKKETGKVEDLNGLVKNTAKELAGDNTEMANKIIESVKQFNLEGLKEAEIKERVVNAAKLVPDYKPKKEQASGKGGKPAGGGEDKDPFGVDQIVEDVSKQREGGGYAL